MNPQLGHTACQTIETGPSQSGTLQVARSWLPICWLWTKAVNQLGSGLRATLENATKTKRKRDLDRQKPLSGDIPSLRLSAIHRPVLAFSGGLCTGAYTPYDTLSSVSRSAVSTHSISRQCLPSVFPQMDVCATLLMRWSYRRSRGHSLQQRLYPSENTFRQVMGISVFPLDCYLSWMSPGSPEGSPNNFRNLLFNRTLH